MMTKKDFEGVASAIAQSVGATRGNDRAMQTLYLVACDVATYLATTNARFDRARFLAACGVAPQPSRGILRADTGA